MTEQKQDNTSESASVQGVEAAGAENTPVVGEAAKPVPPEDILAANLKDQLHYVNWALGDKERLRFATIFDKKDNKFFQRFNEESNRLFVLAVRLRHRSERLQQALDAAKSKESA